MDLVALLPWWAGVLLAIVGYLVLDVLSATPAGVATPAQMGSVIQRTFVAAFAHAGKIAFPVICVAAAVVSFMRRRQRKALLVEASSRGNDAIATMSWREFEALVGELFRVRGYTPRENFEGGADGGVDLVLTKGGEVTLVQCKHWKSRPVGVTIIRELAGVMAARHVHAGLVVTSGVFTADAIAFARICNVTLWDRRELMAQLRAGPGEVQRSARPGPA